MTSIWTLRALIFVAVWLYVGVFIFAVYAALAWSFWFFVGVPPLGALAVAVVCKAAEDRNAWEDD